MNELISRQAALIKSFESALLEHKDGSIIQCSPEFVSMVVEILKALKAWQWIPCSEGLPEEDFWSGRGRQFSEHVLVTIVNHANDDEQFTDMAQTVDGIWRLSHDTDGDCSLPNWCEIIAWMPLPEPYKGGEA